jgi:hypothetical protein
VRRNRLFTSHVIDVPVPCTHDYLKRGKQVIHRHVSIPGRLIRFMVIAERDAP